MQCAGNCSGPFVDQLLRWAVQRIMLPLWGGCNNRQTNRFDIEQVRSLFQISHTPQSLGITSISLEIAAGFCVLTLCGRVNACRSRWSLITQKGNQQMRPSLHSGKILCRKISYTGHCCIVVYVIFVIFFLITLTLTLTLDKEKYNI